MMDIGDLYQEFIVDHSKHPRNFCTLPEATQMAEGQNPLCGDNVTVFVRVENGVIEEATFQGIGCAISMASASIMTEAVRGKTVRDAEALFDRFRKALLENEEPIDIGKLEVLVGVREYPMRVKCATLPWHALQSALEEAISESG